MERVVLKENRPYSVEYLDRLGISKSLNYLKENKIAEQKFNTVKFRFIGSLFLDDKHILILPKYRREVFTEKELDTFHLALLKFQETNSFVEEDETGLQQDVYYILEDYTRHGLFRSYEKKEINSWDNANWNKMMERDAFYENDMAYWERPISTSICLTTTKLDTIHKSIICYLLEHYPIMKNLIPVSLPEQIPYQVDTLYYQVLEALRTTTLTREHQILTRMLRVLENRAQSQGLVIGTRYVHIFWEQLCKTYLNDASHKWLAQLPKPSWVIKGKEGEASGHRPDIITEDDNTIHIYDAKYYDTNHKQPGVQDITKQILYKKCFESLVKDRTITNNFLFPSSEKSDTYMHKSGLVSYEIFGEKTEIVTYHQYDMDLLQFFVN